jgi:hypothetical protein
MATKRKAVGYSKTVLGEETLTSGHGVMQPSTPNVNRDSSLEQDRAPEGRTEVIVVQASNKMVGILQNLIERRAPRGEETALEQFLKFQPPTSLGRAEQDQRVEQCTEQNHT